MLSILEKQMQGTAPARAPCMPFAVRPSVYLVDGLMMIRMMDRLLARGIKKSKNPMPRDLGNVTLLECD